MATGDAELVDHTANEVEVDVSTHACKLAFADAIGTVAGKTA